MVVNGATFPSSRHIGRDWICETLRTDDIEFSGPVGGIRQSDQIRPHTCPVVQDFRTAADRFVCSDFYAVISQLAQNEAGNP
jgi:hypothetical protein